MSLPPKLLKSKFKQRSVIASAVLALSLCFASPRLEASSSGSSGFGSYMSAAVSLSAYMIWRVFFPQAIGFDGEEGEEQEDVLAPVLPAPVRHLQQEVPAVAAAVPEDRQGPQEGPGEQQGQRRRRPNAAELLAQEARRQDNAGWREQYQKQNHPRNWFKPMLRKPKQGSHKK